MTSYSDERVSELLLRDPLNATSSSGRQRPENPVIEFLSVNSVLEFMNKVVIGELLESERVAGSIFLS